MQTILVAEFQLFHSHQHAHPCKLVHCIHIHKQNRITTTSTRTTDKQRNEENNSSGQLKFFHNISIEKQDKPNTESAMLSRDTHTHTRKTYTRSQKQTDPTTLPCGTQGRSMRVVNIEQYKVYIFTDTIAKRSIPNVYIVTGHSFTHSLTPTYT